jgi:hypothetical protein
MIEFRRSGGLHHGKTSGPDQRAAERTRELSSGLNAEEVSRLVTLDMDVQRSERLQPLRTLTVDGQRFFEMLPNKWDPCPI